jgi:ubiquinone/menaquinone biosynthesis C-methylase UbiE
MGDRVMTIAIRLPEGMDTWSKWLLQDRFGDNEDFRKRLARKLVPIRHQLLANADIRDGETVLDIGTGDGFIGFEALNRVGPQGSVIFTDVSETMLVFCELFARKTGTIERCSFVKSSAEDLGPVKSASCDVVTMRSVLIYVSEKRRVFEEFHRVLKVGGRFSLYEPINRVGGAVPNPHSFYGYDVAPIQPLIQRIAHFHSQLQNPGPDSMLDFDERDLMQLAESSGFRNFSMELNIRHLEGPPKRDWSEFLTVSLNPRLPSLQDVLNKTMSDAEQASFVAYLRPRVEAGIGLPIRSAHVYLAGTKT